MRATFLPERLMLTDLARVPDPLACLDRLGPGGGVVLRDQDAPERRRWAERLRVATQRRGQLLFVANDPVMAEAVDADGLHLAERQVGRVSPWGLTSAACHSLQAIRRAERCGADMLLLSPVFPTASHPGAPSLGLHRARALSLATALPTYALGGVTHGSARQLGASFTGWAAIGAFA